MLQRKLQKDIQSKLAEETGGMLKKKNSILIKNEAKIDIP